MEITKMNNERVSLCERFVVPINYSFEKMNALLDHRFNIAKKRYFPTWDMSWWQLHIPDTNEENRLIEWYTHIPMEYLNENFHNEDIDIADRRPNLEKYAVGTL